ncbi:TPA: hypothetical protein HA242_04270 [Candidatus Woesearchaeota archaeon]|nr:hypothetical protein [Candidatus Woesearchaeota archaeon]HIG93467.1 hypothetical protein [Candidatus Woesearchaeota archaeon]HIH12914.1 hypothetical protein [Candidatus Woesearchaeota archaeon]
MSKILRLSLHTELDQQQQQQAAEIYLAEQNWSPIVNADFARRSLYPHDLEEAVAVIVDDARNRDSIFPYGQLILLGKEEEQWKVLGSIHTVVSSKDQIHDALSGVDCWNKFNNYGRLSPKAYNPHGERWVCFAIQTDPTLNKEKWGIKPADTIIRGIKLLAFDDDRDFGDLSALDISKEIIVKAGSYHINAINPLTRLSGFFRFCRKYRSTTAEDYARGIEKIVARDFIPQNAYEEDLVSITKTCSLRYHLSRGARIEKLIPQFRVHDTASKGYGASVLYSP